MKKTYFMYGIIAAALVGLFAAGIVSAHSGFQRPADFQQGTHMEQMEEILESGTYADLQTLREETGLSMARWVDSEEDFEEMQERHEEMDNSGYQRGYGRGQGRMGNCPMYN